MKGIHTQMQLGTERNAGIRRPAIERTEDSGLRAL